METIYALRTDRVDIKRRYEATLSRMDPLVCGSRRKALGATLDDFEASLSLNPPFVSVAAARALNWRAAAS